ncbi:nuclear transcription factor Y subunit B [Glycine max]|uniref:nuclear transcription factor Y subunit B n=1 Tax=Glycine max TaxID=3847 RepID=UPI0003DEC794|nr:nuclear transcription factor Y subunit B [Glycine max]|eukprot:XP_006595292.1 nuclear transcription factor Y subunit B [Glycine max]
MFNAPASPCGSGRGNHESSEHSPRSYFREQDCFLPIANISCIMKKMLPSNRKIAKDAKETLQECVSEFISFVTCEVSDKCQGEKRKTINDDCNRTVTVLKKEEGLNIEKIEKCMGDPDADTDNPILKEEQDAQVLYFIIAINSFIESMQ